VKAEIAGDGEMSKNPSQSRKESMLNCLLIETRGFINKSESKKQIKKIS